MLIKRKLFSVMDEEGNLGYYLYNESTGEEKLFSSSDKEEKKRKHKIRLEDINSHRGLGRSLIISGLSGGGLAGTLGGYGGKKYVEKLDKRGDYTDRELVTKASRAGALGGAALGTGMALIGKNYKAIPVVAGLSAIGAAAGARKNTRARLEKRRMIEDNMED